MGDLKSAFASPALDWTQVTRRALFGCSPLRAKGQRFEFRVSRGLVITGPSRYAAEVWAQGTSSAGWPCHGRRSSPLSGVSPGRRRAAKA
jgi:hypothetical protein